MTQAEARRRLPQVDRLVNAFGDTGLPRPVVVDAVRTVIEAARRRARRTKTVPTEDELIAVCRDELRRRSANLLRPVINATGVILHTNLGRAPMSQAAVAAIAAVAGGYSNLEWDSEHGRRGDRFVHVEPLLAVATGAEAALVVNNNAAAVLLVCAALAKGREVVVSRGEIIEIGGEFRIPEILESSGATMREIGTTNRTHLRDYERAIGEDTAFVLKVHPSNYRVVGFTAAPTVADLARVCAKKNVPLVYDVGSGLLGRELADEPEIRQVITEGVDLVCFSGDKLLGGPQAGIVAGRSELVEPLRSHPLLRALRPDKMQLAALGATVTAHLQGSSETLPVWRAIDASPEEIARRARRLAKALRAAGYDADVVEGESVVGGGSLPGQTLQTSIVRVRREGIVANDLAATLRRGEVPVVVRVENNAVLVDLRTVPPSADKALTSAFVL